ncbi:MAG: DUF3311 domain-containing protein [Natronomonas sp.]
MTSTATKYVWSVVALVLIAFAIPWFLWGTSTVVAGLPVWLWWHIGWMILAAGCFWVFTRRAWGLGVHTVSSRGDGDDRAVGGGDRP